ncbi:potassium channel family protein [Aeromonas allosaccharophila]|uniref:potassium channel family protein n=1 Tax=Aeromonas allosaccharophila TaxID=656 RepID=UPI003D1C8CEC
MFWIFLLGMVCPTLHFAVFMKHGSNKNKVIRSLNWGYFITSTLSFLMLVFYFNISTSTDREVENLSSIESFWIVFLLSRCFEIFYAFLRDALDKISDKDSGNRSEYPRIAKLINLTLDAKLFCHYKGNIKSAFSFIGKVKSKLLSGLPGSELVNGAKLKNHDRLVLSFRSYFELVINFSIIYSLLPGIFWKGGGSLNIIEAMYFSGVTITTLGYGDISPENWFSQFLSVFEVLCGFSLIVVCLAIYLKDEK